MRSPTSYFWHTVRRLLKSPGFTITAVLILGLGIGTNTAMFSLVNGVLLKPLPYPHPEQLVQIFQPYGNYNRWSFGYPDFVDFTSAQTSFQGLAAYYESEINLTGNGEPERISCFYVAGKFFEVFGRPFLLGRAFDENQDNTEAPALVVIGEHFWRKHFQADPGIIGAELVLNDRNFRVIGVTPEQGNESTRVDVYLPFSLSPDFNWLRSERGEHDFSGSIGRLKNGVTLRQAQADLERINQNLISRYPATNKGFGIRTLPYLDSVVSDYAAAIWILEAAVGCLLLIACSNVAALLLVRTQARLKEMGIRAALGARSVQLAGHILGESLLLAITGGILGVFIAWGLLNAIKAFAPESASRLQSVALDGDVFVFTLILILLVTLAAGLIPVLIGSRADPAVALKDASGRNQTISPGRHRGQSLLVGCQVALTAVLLIGAGLMSRSFQALQSVPLGFSPDHVLTADIYLTGDRYDTAKCRSFFDTLLNKLGRLPGVVETGINDDLPFVQSEWDESQWDIVFGLPGEHYADLMQMPLAETQDVSPGYFGSLRIPLLRGRLFDSRDQADTQQVVIINEAIAQRFFPGQDPIGKRIYHVGVGGKQPIFYTIIGVVANIQHNSPASAQTAFQAYFAVSQSLANSAAIVIRTQSDPRAFVPALRKVVADLDPNLAISNVRTFDDRIAQTFNTRRLSALIVDVLSGTALALAAVGLYAVLSYTVSQRTRDIGIRITLGARGANILRLVFREGVVIVGIGMVAGIATALLLVHFVEGNLYSISPYDPAALTTGVLVLSLVALLACLLPALRATRIDPITALRE
jgi:putative ABC transport system permease protein